MHRSSGQRGRQYVRNALGLSLILVLAGCGDEQSSHSHGNSGPSGGVPMAAPVTVTTAIQKTVQPYGEWTGRFEAPESVEIRARVAGIIEHVDFKAGEKVQRGDVLFTLDSLPFEAELDRAEAQLASAKTQSDWSRAEASRSKRLLEAKATSQQEFDQLYAQQRNAEAAVKAADAAVRLARLNLNYTKVRSPITGRVSRAVVTAGNLVGVGTPVLTTVVSMEQMHVYFSMSEQAYLNSINSLGRGHVIPVSMGLADQQGTPNKGRLDFVDNRVNPSTGTVQARAVFENKEGHWMPGLFARIKVPEGAPTLSIMVPDRAIGTDQSKKVVWVVTPDNKALPRDVTLGAAEGNLRMVTSGLKVGERVIVEGTQRVQPGMLVQPELMKEEASLAPQAAHAEAPAAASSPAKAKAPQQPSRLAASNKSSH